LAHGDQVCPANKSGFIPRHELEVDIDIDIRDRPES
jgi:hypothetical protein